MNVDWECWCRARLAGRPYLDYWIKRNPASPDGTSEMNRITQLTIFTLLLLVSKLPAENPDFRLDDGDRVVLLGDALIEQEQYFGWVELMMTTNHADRSVTFRNLGWSADTPTGQSRFGLSLLQAGREPDDEGWKQLVKQLELTKPTVIVFGYGLASAIENAEVGTQPFIQEYQRLLTKAKEISPQVRFVFLTPILPLDLSNPFVDSIRSHASAINDLAEQTGSPVIDLKQIARADESRKDLIHLNSNGYREMALAIESQLGWSDSQWQDEGKSAELLQTIQRKNTWWFHRSRPANMAYVFGFRKHEQGQNAVEIPKFDELVAQEEQRIAALRALKPVELEPRPAIKKSQYAKFTPQPTPEFSMGEDLEITLWAENPLLNKPIQMNFDPQGRLWVASSEAYPMIEVGQSAPDKILILEDTTGDGKADKSTVFAEDLLIPTGVEPGNGGCYVAQSTDLLFLQDTDGDGKADRKTRVLNGFGTEDTHHNLHTLRWGYDGRLYMNQSIYTRTDAETPRGVVRLKAGGGFRYHPDSMRMQVFFRGLVNSWGHQFDNYGQSFLSDGAGFNGLAYSFPGATFNPTPKARKLLGLISPGRYPKFCSLEIISGESFPPEWQGSIVTCDFRANRVTRFSLADDGAGFVTKQEADLCRTSASTFRPIDVKQGPDGALYIADWSNPIINHGEVDFRDPRRDRWHGRIWRVTWKGSKPRQKVDLTQEATTVLLDNLKSNDRFARDQSRRVLIERGESVGPVLAQWLGEQSESIAKLQGLWLAQAIDVNAGDTLRILLGDQDPRIRAAAVRVLGDLADPGTDSRQAMDTRKALDLFKAAVSDQHPRVRLEAVRAVALVGTAEAAQIAMSAIDHPRDRFIDYAIYLVANELSQTIMSSLDEGDWSPNDAQLDFLLTSIPPAQASEFVSNFLKKQGIPKDGAGPWIELVGKTGSPLELNVLYQQVLTGGFDSGASVRAITALKEAQRLRRLRPADGTRGISQLMTHRDSGIVRAAVELAGVWKLRGQVGVLGRMVEDSKQPSAVRSQAIQAMRAIGGGESAKQLSASVSKLDGSLKNQAVIALAQLNPAVAAEPLFQLLSAIGNEQQGVDLWRGVLSNKNAGKVLASKITNQNLAAVAARAGVRVAREGGRKEPELIAALEPLTEISMNAKKLTADEIKALVSKVAPQGDPHRGEAIYRRQELACVSCHAIGGVGGKVGPDMTSLGASAPVDYIAESLFDPNAKIKENYHSMIVATEDGTFSGIEVSSTDEELVLRDAAGKLIKIATDTVLGKKNGPSLMPSGVVDRLNLQEQIDLIRFLSQLGKPGDFDASKANVGRAYEVLAGTHRVEQQGTEPIILGQRKDGWKSLNSLVSGKIQKDTLQEMTAQPINISLVNVYLRTRIQASQSGSATFTVEGPKKVDLWINGKAVSGQLAFTVNVDKGESVVLIRMDARDLPDDFKLSSDDVAFSVQ